MDLCSWIPVNEVVTKIIRSDVAAAHYALMIILMQDSFVLFSGMHSLRTVSPPWFPSPTPTSILERPLR